MKGKNSLPTNRNYNISLTEIKRLNLWNYIEAIGGEYKKKKSSKYGRLYKTPFGSLWIRYDYKTGMFFYCNLSIAGDAGTIIDFIQNHILKEKNLGKVRKYISDNLHLF
jgi:hypothetical protein